MKTFVWAALAGAMLALSGCESKGERVERASQEVREEQAEAANKERNIRADLAEDKRELEQKAQAKAAEVRKDINEEAAKLDQKAASGIAEAREDVREAREDLAKAAHDATRDGDTDVGRGGAGLAGTAVDAAAMRSISGTLGSTLGAQVTVRDAAGNETKLKTDDMTRFTSNGKAIEENDLKEGAKVTVSYYVKGDDRIAREISATAAPAKSDVR